MKSLTQFEKFDCDGFLKEKTMLFVSERDYERYEDGKPVGREGLRVELLIFKDETKYRDGRTQDNLYEKLFVKIPTSKQTLGIELNEFVRVVNVIKASVYGKYRNELSITAEDIVVVESNDD